jgi:osmoprotectant transport system permease protein
MTAGQAARPAERRVTVGFLEFLLSRSDDVVTLGLQHLAVVLVAVSLATLIGVALGVATYRTERPREIVLAVAGAFLTIPSFALLVLFIGPLGMGLDRRQRLLRIELPLAWPVIITGMQVSTLILVGGAAIGAVVLGPGYGELIFAGLYRVGTDVALNLVLAGVLGVVLVALVFEVAFGVLRRLTTSRGLR